MRFRSILRCSVLFAACALLPACAETASAPTQSARGERWSSPYTNGTELAVMQARCVQSLGLPADTTSRGQIADQKLAQKYEDCVVFAMREAAMDRIVTDHAQFNEQIEYSRMNVAAQAAERQGQR